MPCPDQPVPTQSLKDQCAAYIERSILSGELAVGQKLPPPRDLAQQLGIKHRDVQGALVELASKGLLKTVPRVGTLVNDFRKEGSLAVLVALFSYQQGDLAPKLLSDLMAMRTLLEIENARLAALHRGEEDIRGMRDLIKVEEKTDPADIETLTWQNFQFHHLVAIASGNLSYALLLNSCKPVYTNLLSRFFEDPEVVPTAIGFHRDLADAIRKQNEQLAVAVMRCMLSYGDERLRDAGSK
ncbi:MAG: FadR family transcriptional regulator [Desulfobacteraceae bacterium]|nr:MAG: FadR family transcriptional regulator [Desulfobacteraceae bacterium]